MEPLFWKSLRQIQSIQHSSNADSIHAEYENDSQFISEIKLITKTYYKLTTFIQN